MNQMTKRISSGLDDDVIAVDIKRDFDSYANVLILEEMINTIRNLPPSIWITAEDSQLVQNVQAMLN